MKAAEPSVMNVTKEMIPNGFVVANRTVIAIEKIIFIQILDDHG